MESIKALIVDDQKIIRNVLMRSLSSAGLKVETAEDGLIALERLKEESFDVMITDIMMPNMDGISLLLETHKVYPEMPVLIITGYAKKLSVSRARELGAFDLLIKPFKNNEIITSLRRALVSRHQQKK